MPSWSGSNSESTSISTSAWPLSVSSIEVTLPTGFPPTWTSLPLTSWPAVWKVALTVYLSLPASIRKPDEDRRGDDAADGGYSRGSQTGRAGSSGDQSASA